MFKLLVVVAIYSLSSDGGVSVTMHESRFQTEAECLRAKSWLESNQRFFTPERDGYLSSKTSRIAASCFKD